MALAAMAGAEPSGRDWNPTRTYALVVGILEWQDSANYDSFPKPGRRDAALVEWLRNQGVPADQIVYLQDRAAGAAAIETALNGLLDKAGPGSWLLVYYAGHGELGEDAVGYMVPYDMTQEDEGWRSDRLVARVDERFRGERVLLVADCCHSGSLAEQVRNHAGRGPAMAALCSSTVDSGSTGNWTFTDCFLMALRGDPVLDANRDGCISLAETGRFADQEMTFAEDQHADCAAEARFGSDVCLARVARPLRRGEGRHVEVLYQGEYYKARVLEEDGNRVRVHWLPSGDSPDEWVDRSQLNPRRLLRSTF